MKHRNSIFLLTALALFALSGCAPRGGKSGEARTLEHNRLIARRYFDEVWNQGKLDALDELLDENYLNHTPSAGSPPPGPDGLKPIVAAIRRAFPDLHYTIEDIVATEDAMAIRVRMSGTHTGDLFGIAPTGKRVEVEQIQIERIRNGKIVEHWRVTDELALMKQIGAVK